MSTQTDVAAVGTLQQSSSANKGDVILIDGISKSNTHSDGFVPSGLVPEGKVYGVHMGGSSFGFGRADTPERYRPEVEGQWDSGWWELLKPNWYQLWYESQFQRIKAWFEKCQDAPKDAEWVLLSIDNETLPHEVEAMTKSGAKAGLFAPGSPLRAAYDDVAIDGLVGVIQLLVQCASDRFKLPVRVCLSNVVRHGGLVWDPDMFVQARAKAVELARRLRPYGFLMEQKSCYIRTAGVWERVAKQPDGGFLFAYEYAMRCYGWPGRGGAADIANGEIHGVAWPFGPGTILQSQGILAGWIAASMDHPMVQTIRIAGSYKEVTEYATHDELADTYHGAIEKAVANRGMGIPQKWLDS